MNCSERYDNLMRYAYGELDSTTSLELESHIAECEKCRGSLEALKSMNTCLRDSLSQHEDSPDMTAAILASIPSQPKPKPLQWILASGLAAVAVLLIIWLNLPAQHEPIKQVKLPEKAVTRTKMPNSPPVSIPQVKKQNVTRKPETTRTAAQPENPKHPVTKRQPVPTPTTVKHVATDQEKQSMTPKAVVDTVNVITVRIDPPQVVTDQNGTRSSTTIKMELCGVEVTHTMEAVTLSPPPNPDAESIQRPELQTVSAGLFGRLSS